MAEETLEKKEARETEELEAPEEDSTKEGPAEESAEVSPESLELAIQRTTVLFSPEAIIMFFVAGLLDLTGLVLVLFGLDDFFILDIIGIIFIGLWTYFRSQTMQVTRGAAAKIGKAAKWAKRMRWLRPLLVIFEFIPYVGVLPCWTLVVYFELQT